MSSSLRRRAFVSLGSNVGDRETQLRAAGESLAALPQTTVLALSAVYETAPQEFTEQPPFLNQVACVETALAPLELLRGCQAIEAVAGRMRTVRFGPRTLDIDILLYEGVEADDPELTLPHPRMWHRAFVLVPLAEIWSHAKGMPEIDVASLAATLAGEQGVERHGAVRE
jgi:2-amino-4-hydroxy-6-hydroxymethyldihydropteridine diphosphokinase